MYGNGFNNIQKKILLEDVDKIKIDTLGSSDSCHAQETKW